MTTRFAITALSKKSLACASGWLLFRFAALGLQGFDPGNRLPMGPPHRRRFGRLRLGLDPQTEQGLLGFLERQFKLLVAHVFDFLELHDYRLIQRVQAPRRHPFSAYNLLLVARSQTPTPAAGGPSA